MSLEVATTLLSQLTSEAREMSAFVRVRSEEEPIWNAFPHPRFRPERASGKGRGAGVKEGGNRKRLTVGSSRKSSSSSASWSST